MNNLKLDNAGGLHLYQDALAYMHNAAREAILQLSKAVGNNAIVEGCEVTGPNISNGIVVINNEIMPFEGGTNFGYIDITEIPGTEDFEDGTPKQVYFTRKAISSASGIALADFKRITPLRDIITAKSDSYKLNDTNTLATAKAVRDLWASIGILGYYVMPNAITVGNGGLGADWYTITHNLDLPEHAIHGSLYFYYTENGNAAVGQGSNNFDINYRNITANSFQVYFRNGGSSYQMRGSFFFLKP